MNGEGKEYEVTTMQRQQLNINYKALLEDLYGPASV